MSRPVVATVGVSNGRYVSATSSDGRELTLDLERIFEVAAWAGGKLEVLTQNQLGGGVAWMLRDAEGRDVVMGTLR